MPDQSSPSWKVLLIGGSSGVGKTGLARMLARHLQLSVLLVDDIRLALRQITSPTEHPGLHVFASDEAAAQLSPEAFRDGLITAGKAIAPAIRMIAAHHIWVPGVGPLIIEGDGILLHIAAQHTFRDLKHFWPLITTDEIRAVFIYEEDEQVLFQNFVARGRGFEDLQPAEQQRTVRASWLYGHWLREQAHTVGQPVVPARPYETLLERVIAALGV